MQNQEIVKTIENLKGRRNYEEKKASKLGFATLYDYLEDKYGRWILYNPDFSKNTYILWLLPILMFLIGGAIIAKLFIIKKN